MLENDSGSCCICRGRKCSIEVGELEKKYKDWQKKLHPDLVHSKTQVTLGLCCFVFFYIKYHSPLKIKYLVNLLFLN